MKSVFMKAVLGAASLSIAACVSNAAPPTPNEFRVVTKAPLSIPPEYNLRPPAAGQSQPFEIDASRAGTMIAFGETSGEQASASEKALVAAAGANAVNPVVRAQIDYEESRVLRKSPSATQRILDAEAGVSPADDSATGDGRVQIEPGRRDAVKLPGT